MPFSTVSRVRDIIDGSGPHLRLSIERSALETVVRLERRDLPGHPAATLDIYGVELLCGFVVAARLATCEGLADETLEGHHGAVFRIFPGRDRRIEISQAGARVLTLPSSLWDRLFAELCIVSAHGRGLATQSASRSLH